MENKIYKTARIMKNLGISKESRRTYIEMAYSFIGKYHSMNEPLELIINSLSNKNLSPKDASIKIEDAFIKNLEKLCERYQINPSSYSLS